MSTRQKKKNPLSVLVIPSACLALLGYFAHHAQTGTHSLPNKELMELRAVNLENQLEQLRHERARMEARIALLVDGTIEKDLLDELSRNILGKTGKNEIIILR